MCSRHGSAEWVLYVGRGMLQWQVKVARSRTKHLPKDSDAIHTLDDKDASE